MKRLSAILLLIVFAASVLCGCGSDKKDDAKGATGDSYAPSQSATAATGQKDTSSKPKTSDSENSKDAPTANKYEGEMPIMKADEGEGAVVKDAEDSDSADNSSSGSSKSSGSSSSGSSKTSDSGSSGSSKSSGSGSSGSSKSSGNGSGSSGSGSGSKDKGDTWESIVAAGDEYGDELPFVPAH